MAEFARQQGFEVEVGRFEEWDPAGRTFDAVIAGMTWHWVDPVAGAAKAGGVLRPGGRLALFWNVQQPPPELARAFSEVYRRVLPGTPFAGGPESPLEAYARFFAKAADGVKACGAFGDPEQWRYDWERPYTKDEWLELVPTFGGHSRFPPAKLDELLAGIGSAIDANGGGFTMGYAAVAVTAATRSQRAPATRRSGCGSPFALPRSPGRDPGRWRWSWRPRPARQ
jgi:SAM-dependent methyltransferase